MSRTKDHWQSSLAWYVTFGCEVLTVIWVLKIVQGWDITKISNYADNWLGQLVATFPDEIIALLMFLAFAFVDLLNWRVYAQEHVSKPNDRVSKEESSFALSQALFVDAPVVVGILMSICLARHLAGKFSDSELYLSGFFSGATVMHLAASQIIFIILAVEELLAYKRAIMILDKMNEGEARGG